MSFPTIADIVPEGIKGIAKIEHFKVSEDDSKMSIFRREYVPVGKYTRLRVHNGIMMSDTNMEQRTNYEVKSKSHGNVLIAGLGIGMILKPILEKPEVSSVLVIEKYQDVIDLVASYYEHPKLTVVCADIFDWKPEKDQKFNAIYFDIWPDICVDNINEINQLHRKGKYWLDRSDSNCWMNSWQAEYLRYLRKNNRWR
jgi:spermidine synthase